MYVKVFPSMYDGTLATHGPWQALVTFQQMLVLADPQGIVDMTPEVIAARTTIPLEIIRIGVAALEEPDPESRSAEMEGRRIVRLADHRSWGWQIVNYLQYRAIRDEQHRRDYMREYRRRRRAAGKDVNNMNKSEHVHTVHRSSPKQKQKQKNKDTRARNARATSIPEDFTISDRVRRWAAEKGHDRLEARFEHFVGQARAKGYTYLDWDEAFMNAIRDNWAKLEPPKSPGYVPSTKVAL